MENIELLNHKIINRLPYLKTFLFIDKLSFVNENNIIGHYTFSKNDFFYKAHFKHIPFIPDVIIIEMMGQIGLVCLVVYLHKLHENNIKFHPILQTVEYSVLKQVYINDKLTVKSEKMYFRKGILKSNIVLFNSNNDICALFKGQIKIVFDK